MPFLGLAQTLVTTPAATKGSCSQEAERDVREHLSGCQRGEACQGADRDGLPSPVPWGTGADCSDTPGERGCDRASGDTRQAAAA